MNTAMARRLEKGRRCGRWQGSFPYGEDEMPKDMRGALIELLETEGDQYDHAWDEALRIF